MALTVKMQRVISDGKQDLVLPQKEVSGLEFVCLEKWNRQLVKMLTGKALDLRPGKAAASGSLSSKVWGEIVEQRQNVANQKLQEALEVEVKDNTANGARKKPKAVRANSKHMIMLPEVLDIECRERGLKVLIEGINTQTIWMHFTDAEEAKPRVTRRSGSKKRARGHSSDEEAEDGEVDGEQKDEDY
ncbi:unnamed protein product [Symbiodinium sp. CCMP2592]|nr:unnamed protein product [Symbiodinium sp. CCMP2592]